MRLVLGQHHRPPGQLQQPGHDLGYHVVMGQVPRAVSFGRRHVAASQSRRYSVRALTCGQPRCRRIRPVWRSRLRRCAPGPEVS